MEPAVNTSHITLGSGRRETPADGAHSSDEWAPAAPLPRRSFLHLGVGGLALGTVLSRGGAVRGDDTDRSDRGQRSRTERLVRHLLQVIETRDTAAIWSLFADDGVIEFPFIGLRVTDLASLDATIGQALAVLDGLTFFDLVFEPMADPLAVIVKHKGHAVVSFTGKPYEQMYINEVHVRGNKITSFVEYYDTAVFDEAFTP